MLDVVAINRVHLLDFSASMLPAGRHSMLIVKAEALLIEVPCKNFYQTTGNITTQGARVVFKSRTDTVKGGSQLCL